jgi:hypothetical protein
MGIAAALPTGISQTPVFRPTPAAPFVPAIGMLLDVLSAYGFNEIQVGWAHAAPSPAPLLADSITIEVLAGPGSPPLIGDREYNIRPGVRTTRIKIDGSNNFQIKIKAINTVANLVQFAVAGASPLRFRLP